MSDFPPAPTANAAGDNRPVFSVSEISAQIKRALERDFEWVRVKGEISGFKRAASGHLYLALKDADAVLDAVCWRGTAGRLAIKPEDGLEVIASGRITSYAGRSKYQLIVEQLEIAGEGALLKLLEERRKRLAAEGLFDAQRKKPLPFLPQTIGVVTSPTGAVIRDILHRLADRFPRRVLLWPVLVQGEGAADQVARAIAGFNALEPGGALPRPDLVIVARGGGSLEDLWAFNEEVVVRAAAASAIPLISAVGHETDTTLIDFAADRRAPTPSAAAEMAVPVRAELLSQLAELERRRLQAWSRSLAELRTRLEALARGLPEPRRLLAELSQRLDERAERLFNCGRALIEARRQQLRALQLATPRAQIAEKRAELKNELRHLESARIRFIDRKREAFARLDAGRRLARCAAEQLRQARNALAACAGLLESLSYHNVLKRGFAVVHGPDGVIQSAQAVTVGLPLALEFADGRAAATGDGGAQKAPSVTPKPAASRKGKRDDPQGNLL
ncbi:MAG: exodeoxyribonuclease VII large subunit [Kiloniellales bacterium]